MTAFDPKRTFLVSANQVALVAEGEARAATLSPEITRHSARKPAPVASKAPLWLNARKSKAARAGMSESEVTLQPTELKRALTLMDMIVYGLVFITPVAPLSTFGIVFNASHGMVALVYVVGLGAMVITALSYMTMSETFPVAGSVYSYATHGIGERIGLIAGWALLLDYLLIPSMIYVICAIAVHEVLPIVPKSLCILSLLSFNTCINLAGIKATARSGLVLLSLQLLLLMLFFALGALGLMHGLGGAKPSFDPLFNRAEFSPQIVFGALSLATVSFLGFDGISTLAEENRGSVKSVGRAALLALTIAAFLFIAQTYLAALFVPGRTSFAPGQPTDAAFYEIAQLVGGYPFKWIMSVAGVLLGGIAGALAAQTATARLIFGMARDGRFPRGLAHVSGGRNVPDRAIILVAVFTMIIAVALVDRLELLASMVNFGALTGFMMLHASVLVHHHWRKRSRAWFKHLVSPMAGIVILAYVLWNAEPAAKLAGIGWLCLGFVIYVGAKVARRLSLSRSLAGPTQ